jgi:hypothetical protein
VIRDKAGGWMSMDEWLLVAGMIRSRSSLQWTDKKRDVMEDVELLQN